MTEKAKVVDRSIIHIGNLILKTYTFDSAMDHAKAVSHLDDALSAHGVHERESMGISFLYGLVDDRGFVNGTDTVLYRDIETENPMLDSWTFENGVYFPKEKGIMCTDELLLLAKEEEDRRKALQYLRNGHITRTEFMGFFLDFFPR